MKTEIQNNHSVREWAPERPVLKKGTVPKMENPPPPPIPYLSDIIGNIGTDEEKCVIIRKSSACGPTQPYSNQLSDMIFDSIPKNKMGTGLRHDNGKLRYDLEPEFARREYMKVMTFGANKYADRNWEKGMLWSKVIGPMKRHMAALLAGEDYDFDPNCDGCKSGNCLNHSGLLHSAHIQWNAAVITEYYKIYPQGDDRPHAYLQRPKIGLDIDEVICDWVNPWCELHGLEKPDHWNFSYDNLRRLTRANPEELETFYANLPARISPKDIPFEPHCYITSRSIDTKITERWLEERGFPTAPVYSVGFGESKIDVARKSGIDIFVDDRYENFVELNNAGICTFLMDAAHNQKYNVGFKRLKSLRQLIDFS